MEEWQIQFTNENLTKLITSIRCNDLLLAYLVEFGALSQVDMDHMNSIQGGEIKKACALINILQTRAGGYGHLAKALKNCKQSGAFSILLKGIQKHVIFRDVYFGGVRLPLQNVCKYIGQDRLPNIIKSEMNDETYEEFLNLEPWTLESETVPNDIPYYIPRSLSINTQIDPEIFQKLEHHIFCIEGMDLQQLSGLASRNGQLTNHPDRSRNQIDGVTTRFILLERPDHFPAIAEKAERHVHWLKYEDGKYWYVKIRPGNEIRNVGEFLVSKFETNVSEDEFVERCPTGLGNEPVFIYDSPGMGKSLLLACLSRKMKEKRPEDSVIHFDFSELVRKVRHVDESCSYAAVKRAVVDCVAVNGLGRRIMTDLLDSRDHQIQLFLDGYDEVLQSEYSDANIILDSLVKEGRNIRVFVATRPHKQKELEEKFEVLGYNIMPFTDSDKLSFFLKYWESEHGVEPTDKIKKFAEHCLKTLQFEMSSEEGDIAGIPFQYRMLAEIYAEDAKRGCQCSTGSKLQFNSIFQVYKHFIDTKFATFCTDEERQNCYDFHSREALRILFPEKSVHFNGKLLFPDVELIYRIGILEPLKADPSRHGFSHRTLAEYFAADFLATYATSKFHMIALQNEFIQLFFQQALMRSSVIYWHETNFENPVVCRFLNFFLSFPYSEGGNFEAVENSLRKSNCYNSDSLIELLKSSLRINAEHLYLFLLQVYLDLEESSHKTNCFIRFKDNLHNAENWEVKDAKKLQLVKDLKNEPKFNSLHITAVQYSSLNLVKLSCAFLESVTGKKFLELEYEDDENPMELALQRGHYQIFEYLLSFDREGFYNHPLLHWCLDFSYGKYLGDKVQIVKGILEDRPDFLNRPHPHFQIVPLLALEAHFSLIKILIEGGADLTQTTEDKKNIAHRTAEYLSAEEYHEFVQLIISQNAQSLFQERDGREVTPVHWALKHIDLKSETLELLAKKCNVTFNDKLPGYASELEVAIKVGRSERVIKDIIRLRGDVNKLL